MEKYKLSENIDSNKIFIVNRSEIEGRLDPIFYVERFDFEDTIKLSKIAKIKGGKRIPKGYDYSNEETSNLYLRVANMDENNDFKYSDFKFISDELYNRLKGYEVFDNELIISIAGTVGKTKVISNIPDKKKVILTENCAKIVISDNINSRYLNIVMQTPFLQKQISASYIQTTIPKLGIDKILELRIPNIPPIEKQLAIVKYYNKAYTQKQEKEAEAQRLLDSIDNYLLGELGIVLPNEEDLQVEPNNQYGYALNTENPLVKNGRLFLTGSREVSGWRIDPDYTMKFKLFSNSVSHYPYISLKNLLIKSPQYGANEEAQDFRNADDIRYVRITDIDEIGNLKPENKKTAAITEEKYILNYNDLLFARSGSVGKCYIHKNISETSIFAGYLIRFVIDVEKCNPDFLFYYCNSKLYKYWVSTIERPAVQSNINAEEYKSLPIPLPPLKKTTRNSR